MDSLYGISKSLGEDLGLDYFISNETKYHMDCHYSSNTNRKYFRIFNSDRHIQFADKLARIDLFTPNYIFCDDDYHHHFYLNYEDKKWLMRALNYKSYIGISIWQLILYGYNHTFGEGTIDPNLPMPNYMLLPENYKENNL